MAGGADECFDPVFMVCPWSTARYAVARDELPAGFERTGPSIGSVVVKGSSGLELSRQASGDPPCETKHQTRHRVPGDYGHRCGLPRSRFAREWVRGFGQILARSGNKRVCLFRTRP